MQVAIGKADVTEASEIGRVLAEFAKQPDGALIILPNPVVDTHRATIIDKAMEHRLSAIYPFRYFAVDGGLAAYGADQNDQFRRAAGYADRILRGENPADLPSRRPPNSNC